MAVKISRTELQNLAAALRKASILVDEAKIRRVFNSGFRIITLKDEKTPFTLDILLSDKKLEKKPGKRSGLPTFYQTPEGLVLSKLRMIKVTILEEKTLKDKEDIKAILKYTEVDLKNHQKTSPKRKHSIYTRRANIMILGGYLDTYRSLPYNSFIVAIVVTPISPVLAFTDRSIKKTLITVPSCFLISFNIV